MLETSAQLLNFFGVQWPMHIINPVGKTKINYRDQNSVECMMSSPG